MDGFNIWIEGTMERISKLEDRTIENIQSGQQRK